MKKKFIAFMAALLIIPFFGSAVLAEEVVYEDGQYDVPFEMKQATEDATSAAQSFVDNPAKLTVENGKLNFQLTTAGELQSLTVSGTKANLVSEGEKKDFAFTLQSGFSNPVTMDMHVIVNAGPIDYDSTHTVRTIFDMSNVPVVEEVVEEPTEPETEEPTEPEEEPTEPEVDEEEGTEEEPTEPETEEKTNENKANASDANLVDSAEKFEATYVSDINLARNFENPVTVVVKDGKHYIQINGSGAQYIDSLTLNGEEVIWGAIDADGNYTAQFAVDALEDTQQFTMNLSTPMGAMNHTANIYFEAIEDEVDEGLVDSAEKFAVNYVSDLNLARNFENPVTVVVKDGQFYIQMNGSGAQFIDSLTLNGEELTLYNIDEDGNYTTQFAVDALADRQEFTMNLSTPMGAMTHTANIYFEAIEADEEPVEPEEPVVTPEPTPEPEKPVTEEPKVEVKPLEADKAQTIGFVFYDATGQKVSAANGFFEQPAVLLEKDGVQYVQITTNGNDYIKSLSNRFGEFNYVGEDATGNHVYQFRVDGDLTEEQVIDMVISVPGIYDAQEYTTRLVLDVNSLKDVDVDDYELVESDHVNGPDANGKPVLDPNTPEKPVIADSVDNTDAQATDANTANAVTTAGLNPKTGENTNIMLYVLLMLVSAVPIAVQVRRRFA